MSRADATPPAAGKTAPQATGPPRAASNAAPRGAGQSRGAGPVREAGRSRGAGPSREADRSRAAGGPRATGPRRGAGALLAAALGVLALLLAACGDNRSAAADRPGSTLSATLVDRDGDGFLERGPAEPLLDRGDRARPGATIATFAQLTDTHVRDEESPARVPFLDRVGPPFTSTFRPQEAFSTQVLDAAVRSINRERPQAVFITGDVTDNAQRNELALALATLRGGTVKPDSGARGYDGVQAPDSADPFFYRPDHDAPAHPGALARAQRPFKAAGLDAPWYALVGNHDVLAQGEVPATERINAFAVGDRLVPTLDPEIVERLPRDESFAKFAVDAALADDSGLETVRVPRDSRRRLVSPGEAERALSQQSTVDLGPRVRAITVDTVNREGTSQARVTPEQIAALRAQLTGDRWVVVFSHNRLPEEALQALDEHPRVVAAISGNSHRNQIRPRGRYWLVSTSSLADFPQQARMFRLRETSNGVALETWMVDHDGRGLAGIARELAFLDAQGGRPQRFAGERSDRNTRLYVSER
jgi:Calcineurin-like phosphoesterase